MNELQQIRQALNLSQAEMGKLLGVGQSGYQRWESAPSSPAAIEAAEKAKGIYAKRKGRPWEPSAGGPAPYVTRGEFEDVPGRLKRLEEDIRALLPLIQAVKDLDARVRKSEGGPESPG